VWGCTPASPRYRPSPPISPFPRQGGRCTCTVRQSRAERFCVCGGSSIEHCGHLTRPGIPMSSGRSLPCAPRPTHTGILTALYAVNASGGPVEGYPASRRQTTCPGGVSSWTLVMRHGALAPRKWLPGSISTTGRQPCLALGFMCTSTLDGNTPGVHESTREASGALLPLKPGLCSPLEQGGELAAPCQGRTVSLYTGRGGDIEWQHAGYALKHGPVFQTDATVKGDHFVGRY
jgi:hypothetical protein